LEQPAEKSKQWAGHLKVKVIEENKEEALLTAKLDYPALRRVQVAIDLRKSKRQQLLSKKRYLGLNQDRA
jgi:hypothetical protein